MHIYTSWAGSHLKFFYNLYICRDIRETWIRAKYIDKAFVARPKLTTDAAGKKQIRKWSVRKPHRRQKKGSENTANGKPGEDLKALLPDSRDDFVDATSSELKLNDDTNSETESFQSIQSKETSSASDQEGVLVFGSDLPPSHTDVVHCSLDDEDESVDELDLREMGEIDLCDDD